MTSRELMAYETENVGFQLEQVLANMSEHVRHAKLTEAAMSPHDAIEHLTECYVAALDEAEGREHDWGSFRIEPTDWDARMDIWRQMRSRALASLLSEDEAKLKACSGYIVAHDAYHVGQLALLRFACDPEWNPYSIYRF